MTRTETFTQTTNTPISTAAIRETQQLDNTRRIFTQLLQEYIASLQPPAHDTNHPTVGVVPCADPVPPCADPVPPCADPVPPCADPGLASASHPTDPFTIYQTNLATATPQPVQWLWQQRLPLSGITLLDGDHLLGKTTLAYQIAASVSSGSPMPDGTPTIQGSVIIITPHTDPSTTQLQRLTDLGADLSRIKILSYIHDPASTSQPSGHRPFSLPEDLPRLFDAIDQFDARLIILDPFIKTLSRQHRCTTHHLNHLLADLNQRLIERRVACLLVRNCHARGGHARLSALERSDDFPIIAISSLLLAPDPINPNHILLSHALSRHAALTHTLTLQIHPLPTNPNLSQFTVHGTHCLTANHLLTRRPDTLHRHLLSQHLYSIIARATEPVAAPTLYAQSPHSSPSQVQRALKDLLQTGQILRPTRGFYTLNPTAPTQLETPAATMVIPTKAPQLDATATTNANPIIASKLDASAATTSTPAKTPKLDAPAAITPTPIIASKLDASAATTLNPTTIPDLNITATTNANPIIATTLDASAATTITSTTTIKLDTMAAITPTPSKAIKLESTAATTSDTPITPELNITATITPNPTAATNLNTTAAITSNHTTTTTLDPTAAITLGSKTPHHQHSHNHQHKQKKWRGRPGQSKKR